MKLHVQIGFNIPDKFFYSWGAYYDFSFDIQNTQIFSKKTKFNGGRAWDYRVLRDLELINRIKDDFRKFKKSKKSLNEFFERQIIFCRKTKDSFKISEKEIVNSPLFVWLPSKNSPDLESVNYRISHSEISAEKPIQMSLEKIFALYGIHENFVCISELEDKHQIAIDLFKTDGSDHWRSNDLPGFKCGDVKYRIKIGKNENNETFWIPPKSATIRNYRCRKFPGKCRYENARWDHIVRHEKTCIDETELVTQKVSL